MPPLTGRHCSSCARAWARRHASSADWRHV